VIKIKYERQGNIHRLSGGGLNFKKILTEIKIVV